MRTFLFALSLLTSFKSYSDCEESYRVFTASQKEKGSTLSSIGATSSPVGTLVYSTAINTGGMPLVVGSSIGLTLAGPVLTTVGSVSYIRAKNYDWVKKVIFQSKIEIGKELENFVDDLSELYDRDISKSQVATIVTEANTSELFCPEEMPLFSKKEFKNYVKDQLK